MVVVVVVVMTVVVVVVVVGKGNSEHDVRNARRMERARTDPRIRLLRIDLFGDVLMR